MPSLESSEISYHVVEHTKGLIALIEALQVENKRLRERIVSLEDEMNTRGAVKTNSATLPNDLVNQAEGNSDNSEVCSASACLNPGSQATVPPEETDDVYKKQVCVTDSLQLAMDLVISERVGENKDEIIELPDSPVIKSSEIKKRARGVEVLPALVRKFVAKPVTKTLTDNPGKNYRESVKKRVERENMPAFECQQCQAFYNLSGMRPGLCQKHGKHRMHRPPTSTPPGFWDPWSFQDRKES